MSEPLSYQPSHSGVYYTAPKNLNLFRTITGTLVAAQCIVIGAIIYAKLLPGIGLIQFRCIAVVVFSAGVACVCHMAVQHGKVRLTYVAALIGAFLGLLAIFVMWLVWVVDELRTAHIAVLYGKLIIHPLAFYHVVVALNEVGTWEMHSDMVRGPPLLILWLGEAGIVLAGAVLMSIKGVRDDEVTCLMCGQKCQSIGRFPRFDAAARDTIAAAIENRDFPTLLSQPAPQHEDAPELGLSVSACPKCKQTNVLTLTRISWTIKNNRAQVALDPLINQLLITSDETEQLRQIREQIAEMRK